MKFFDHLLVDYFFWATIDIILAKVSIGYTHLSVSPSVQGRCWLMYSICRLHAVQ